MDWDKLRTFYTVAQSGSFTSASDTLHLSQSAISRQISTLEESIKTPLFHRHARGLIMTEQGEFLYQTVQDVFEKLSLVETRIKETKEDASGPLRLTTTVAFGSIWLVPRLNTFLEKYPHIEITMILCENELDLVRDADIAIRMTPPKQNNLIQRQLSTFQYKIVGSKKYFQRHKIPENIHDLDQHQLVTFGPEPHSAARNVNWILKIAQMANPNKKPFLCINNIYGIYQAVQNHLGIAALPYYMTEGKSELEHIHIPNLQAPTPPIYFVYQKELRHSKRLNLFKEFLLESMNSKTFIS